ARTSRTPSTDRPRSLDVPKGVRYVVNTHHCGRGACDSGCRDRGGTVPDLARGHPRGHLRDHVDRAPRSKWRVTLPVPPRAHAALLARSCTVEPAPTAVGAGSLRTLSAGTSGRATSDRGPGALRNTARRATPRRGPGSRAKGSPRPRRSPG